MAKISVILNCRMDNGKDVKQGVYFVLVKAKGADGRKFNIRKDVNLLRGYTETTTGDN